MRNLIVWVLISVGLSGCADQRAHLRATVDNNKGVALVAQEEDVKALESFIRAAVREPFDPRIQMNLGLAYELLEDFDKAYQSYHLVLETEDLDSSMEFQALFNLARVEGARKNIEQALSLYQRALRINPVSVEVKHNIELLLSEGGGSGGEGGEEGGEGEGEQPQQPQNPENKDQPQPEDLSPQDVQQILEELSRQEKRIRAKEMEQESGEPQNGKNW